MQSRCRTGAVNLFKRVTPEERSGVRIAGARDWYGWERLKFARRISKGIVLAGGSRTRPPSEALVTSKQLMPTYDKPMICCPALDSHGRRYPRGALIVAPRDRAGDEAQWGISISYAEQPKTEGLTQAYVMGADFVAGSRSALVLGDYVFHGHGLSELCRQACAPSSPTMRATQSALDLGGDPTLSFRCRRRRDRGRLKPSREADWRSST